VSGEPNECGSMSRRVGEGRRGVLARGLNPASSSTCPGFGIAFLRVFGEKKKGRGDKGVRGDGKGEVACEEELEEL
jgi:hypothetical protein